MTMPTKSLLVIALAALAFPAQVAAFHNDDVPVIFSTGGSGSGSYGVRYDHGGGDFAIDLYGVGPGTAQSVSVAAFVFDANKNLVFGFAFTGHSSPDRLILSPAGMSGSPEALPEWLDLSASTWDSSTDAACTYACMGISGTAAPAGTYYYLLWAAGVSATSLEIRSNGGSAVANAGAAYSIGDAEIESGTPNAQVGQQGVGVKAMLDAGATIDVEDKLWGFWGNSDFKLACQFTAGACVWRSTVTYQCYSLGVSCDTTQISYTGPNGGGTGFTTFFGANGGEYTFTVDRKIDAYAPGYYEPTTGTFVFLGEDYTYLTAADNDLP